MATLHAPTAAVASADVQIKLPDDDARDGPLFLILVDDPGLDHRTGAVRTVRGERRVVALVHAGGTSPLPLPSIRRARLPARSLRLILQRFRERRRLPKPGSPRLVELSFQVIDLVAEPFLLPLQLVTLPSQRLVLSSQRLALAFRVFGSLAPVDLCRSAIRIAWFRRPRHAAVMPEFAERYKTR
jgi:hypothetical protein